MTSWGPATEPSGGDLVIEPLPGVGDLVWHLPYLAALAGRATGGRITLLTKPRSRAHELLAGCPHVARVLWLERNAGRHDGLLGLLRLAALLRPYRFRRAWILHESWRYAAACRLAGIPERIGFADGAQRLFLNAGHGLPAEVRGGHPVDKAAAFLAANGIPLDDREPRLPLPDAVRRAAEARLDGMPRPVLALGIGASEPWKRWGAERFATLLERLDEFVEGTAVLLGGPPERELSAAILGAARVRRLRLASVVDAPLMVGAAVAAESRFYVGNDTAWLNLAAAVGTPAVGLFGATPPLRHSPRIRPVLPPDGRPSKTDGMSRIGPAAVIEALLEDGLLPGGCQPAERSPSLETSRHGDLSPA